MPLLLRAVCCLLLGLTCLGAWALDLHAGTDSVNVVDVAEVLEDSSGMLDIDAVRSPPVAARFRPALHDGSALNFGFTKSAYWLRIPLSRVGAAPKQWLLEIPYAQLNEVELHSPEGPPVITGSRRPLSSRPVFHRYFAFPLQIGTEPRYFYVRATSHYALTLPLVLWNPEAFSRHQQRVLMLQFLYAGGLLALLLYNLLLFLSLRDRRFFFYSFYALFFGLGMVAGNGYGRLMLWTESPFFDEISQSAMLGAAGVFMNLFARSFLRSRDKTPRLDGLMRLSCAVYAAIVLTLGASLWTQFPIDLLNQALMLNAVLGGALIFLCGWKVWLGGDKGARFFVLAWTILWLGILAAVLRAFEWLPSNTLTSYAVQIASIFEMLLLSLALADIIRAEREARESLQKQALDTQHQLVQVLKASEETLEGAVKERTEKLNAALAHEKEMLVQYRRFGSLISHEFRNPLAIIDSQLSVLRKEHERGLDQVEKRVTVIGSAAQRLKRLFESWLQSDQIIGNLKQVVPRWIPLPGWLERMVEAHAYQLINHDVRWHCAKDVKAVWADESCLEIAVSNLLDNASKYSTAGSTIQIEARQSPDWVGIAVTDQGCGIAPQHQEEVFQAFYRAAPETSVTGMGLGLAMVQRIMQAHGGRIELHSKPGKGSSFCLWLPNPTHAPENEDAPA